MAINCTVLVIDANDAPIAGAQVAVGARRGATDPAGRFTTPVDDPAAPTNLVQVSHPYYVTEIVTYGGDMRTGAGSNPLVSRATDKDGLTLTVRLGRLDTVPGRRIPDEEMKQILATPAKDPHAAVLWGWPGDPKVNTYQEHWNTTRTVWRADPVPVPTSLPPNVPTGWARFVHDTLDVNIASLGRFYWLLYPYQPTDPQYLVAVWSPNLGNATPLESLDMVVYFSPHTAEYPKTYPYGLYSWGTQAYFNLGKKYLLDEFFFVFQLLARRNRSIVVMPICKHGDWGPFASGEAMLRLLREVSVFLHRQARTSSLGVRPPSDNPDELAGPNLRRFGIPLTAPDFGKVPTVGRVAVSAFSTGAVALKTLMTDRAWNTALGSAMWGVPSGNGPDPRTVWSTAWRELWDMDGFHPDTGGWNPYLDQLKGWFSADPQRIARLYHSSGRVPPDPMTDPHAVWKLLRGGGLDVDRSVSQGGLWARFLQNKRFTSLRMSDSYVAPGPGGEQPSFLDAHHTTPRVAFSHAASVTKLGTVQP